MARAEIRQDYKSERKLVTFIRFRLAHSHGGMEFSLEGVGDSLFRLSQNWTDLGEALRSIFSWGLASGQACDTLSGYISVSEIGDPNMVP